MPELTPLVSVIILNYNGKQYLQGCVNSVLKNQYPNLEVILVDNASTDDSLQQVQDLYGSNPKLRIIKSSENLGFSGGNNLGYEKSRGKYIVFLNNDTLVEPDWLNSLVDALETDPSIGIAQSLVYQFDGKTIQTAGWVFSDYLIKKIALCLDKPNGLGLKPIYDVSFVSGASMIIRREILDTMGAFEPKVPFFYDDTLLSLKTRLLGKRAVTIADSRMYHAGGATSIWKKRFTTYNLFKAKNILIFDIFYKRRDLIKAVTLNTISVASDVNFNIMKGDTAAVIGIIDAFAWALRNFPFIWQSRLKLWSAAEVPPAQIGSDFVKVKIPIAFYLFPSQTLTGHITCATNRYEKSIRKK